MLAAIGDLVEDVVVLLQEDINLASDTATTVIRRRGGSAANVVAAACRAGGRARFIGQVGDDPTGWLLCDQLAHAGAELAVRHEGRTGTVIALVDRHGERSMLSDRATSTALADPDAAWLDGVTTLHVPFYSLVGEPLANTTRTLARWARDREILISIDTSSAALLSRVGAPTAIEWMREMGPSVVFANALEAAVLGEGLRPDELGGALVVIKHGPDRAVILAPDKAGVEVPALRVDDVRNSTGAGDAFAAGVLLALEAGADPPAAVQRGHEVAADHLRGAAP